MINRFMTLILLGWSGITLAEPHPVDPSVDRAMYFGLSAGRAETGIDGAAPPGLDSSTYGYKIFGGYRFTRYLSGEIGLAGFGDLDGDLPGSALDTVSYEYAPGVLDAALILSAPLGHSFTAYARGGYAAAYYEATIKRPFQKNTLQNVHAQGTTAGAGVSFAAYGILYRLEYERIRVDDKQGPIPGKLSTKYLSLGISLFF